MVGLHCAQSGVEVFSTGTKGFCWLFSYHLDGEQESIPLKEEHVKDRRTESLNDWGNRPIATFQSFRLVCE